MTTTLHDMHQANAGALESRRLVHGLMVPPGIVLIKQPVFGAPLVVSGDDTVVLALAARRLMHDSPILLPSDLFESLMWAVQEVHSVTFFPSREYLPLVDHVTQVLAEHLIAEQGVLAARTVGRTLHGWLVATSPSTVGRRVALVAGFYRWSLLAKAGPQTVEAHLLGVAAADDRDPVPAERATSGDLALAGRGGGRG